MRDGFGQRFEKFTDLTQARTQLSYKLNLIQEVLSSNLEPEELQKLEQIIEAPNVALNSKLNAMNLFHKGSKSPQHLSLAKKLYIEKLEQGPEPEVKLAALESLITNRLIRPDNFEQVISKVFMGNEPQLKRATLEYIKAQPFASKAVDIELRRLANGSGTDISADLKKEAAAVYEARVAAGKVWTLNPTQSSNEIAEGYIGNTQLKQKLEYALMKYEKGLQATENAENVVVYLPGEPGVGKTTLARALAKTGFGMDQLVVIDMGHVQSAADLKKQLQAHTPLAGKVVLFDEMQEVAENAPDKLQEILAFIKPILTSVQNSAMSDYKNAFIVVASNGDLKKIPAFKSTSSIRGFTQRVDVGIRIDLNNNMREHLEEFVTSFDSKKLYKNDFPGLAGMNLSLSAKAYLLNTIQEAYADEPQATLSGRELVAMLAQPIEAALNAQQPNRTVGDAYTVQYNPTSTKLEIMTGSENE